MDYKVAGKEKKWEIADLLIPWIPVLALFFLTAGLPFSGIPFNWLPGMPTFL